MLHVIEKRGFKRGSVPELLVVDTEAQTVDRDRLMFSMFSIYFLPLTEQLVLGWRVVLLKGMDWNSGRNVGEELIFAGKIRGTSCFALLVPCVDRCPLLRVAPLVPPLLF